MVAPYYEEAGIAIYCADCRAILPQLAQVDLVLTDPPYGIGADMRQSQRANTQGRNARCLSRDYGKSNWDQSPPAAWLFGLLCEVARFQIIWGGNFFALGPSSCWLVWDKANGDNTYADCELAWTNLDKAVRRIVHQWHGMLRVGNEARFHPTQKPLAVMKWALQHAPDDCELILDPFMGSGTTLVAAKQLGRRAIGIEIEQRYCDIAIERLRQNMLPLAEHSDAEPIQDALIW